MSYSEEPSYYEIALTNRQVITVFVVLLTCVVAAFLSGVWIGRRGALPAGETEVAAAETPPPAEEAPLRELRFFSEDSQRQASSAPLKGIAENAPSDTTLREDLGGQKTGGEPSPPLVAERPGRKPAGSPAKPPAATPPQEGDSAAPGAATVGDHVVQVFSSADQKQAERVVQRLSRGGLPAFLSPVDVRGQTMYRVRVGPYRERNEAEAVAERVRRAFKLDTWVTQYEQL